MKHLWNAKQETDEDKQDEHDEVSSDVKTRKHYNEISRRNKTIKDD